MLYLKTVRFTAQDRAEWPFTLPPFRGLEQLDFQSPITLLAGENGSGKSTLLEALA
ncbi:MAG TPA: AAA family ATPase, partial [Clostridia bacterium]|nr:AAA family ATPase [Clostridia bacterium]